MSGPDADQPSGGTEALARYRAAARRRSRSGSAPGTATGLRRRQATRALPGTPSGPGPDARDPQPIGRLWRRLADERGWTSEMAVWSLTNRWAQIVGPQVAEHVAVAGFDPTPTAGGPGGTAAGPRRAASQQQLLPGPVPDAAPGPSSGGKLTLRADSNAWQQQMVWNLVHLQRRLDEELGGGVVGSIVVLGPAPPRRNFGNRRV